MHSVCRLRLYTDEDRLLTGRPRFDSCKDQLQPQMSSNTFSKCKAMSSHTNDMRDVNYHNTPVKRPNKFCRAQPSTRSNDSQPKHIMSFHNNPNNDMEVECHSPSPVSTISPTT